MCTELERAKRFRQIAEKLRAMVEGHPEFQEPLVLTAEDYDAMAEAIEALYRPVGKRAVAKKIPSGGSDEPEL